MLNYNSDLNKINKIVVHDKNTTYLFTSIVPTYERRTSILLQVLYLLLVKKFVSHIELLFTYTDVLYSLQKG